MNVHFSLQGHSIITLWQNAQNLPPPSPPYSHLFGLSSPLPLQRSKLNLNSPYHHYLHHHFSQKEYPKFTGIQMVLIIRYGLLISLLILTKYKQID